MKLPYISLSDSEIASSEMATKCSEMILEFLKKEVIKDTSEVDEEESRKKINKYFARTKNIVNVQWLNQEQYVKVLWIIKSFFRNRMEIVSINTIVVDNNIFYSITAIGSFKLT